MRLVFDLEANGLLDDASRIHCIEAADIDTGETYSFGPDAVAEGTRLLQGVPFLAAHNGIGYDRPTIEKVLGVRLDAFLHDTIISSQMLWPNISVKDAANRYYIPKHLYGHYSLEAFGYRLGVRKGEFKGPWDQWSQEMQDYCKQDVQVTLKLFREIEKTIGNGPKDSLSPLSLEIEMAFAEIMHRQERTGVCFDAAAAEKLRAPMAVRIMDVQMDLQETVPPTVVKMKKVADKVTPFNPGSRNQAIKFFMDRYGWKPTKTTKSGAAKLDEDVLESLPYPEAKKLLEYFKLQKLLGQLADGDKAWLKKVKDGRLHGRVNTVRAVTGRCSHENPNLAQIPSAGSFMGKEVRALFGAPRGRALVGADAKGLELRCFAHYLYPYDGGEYAKVILEGDIHVRNQTAAGLATRDQAKTFIYALLYGAGAEKMGTIVLPGETDKFTLESAGLQAKRRFEQAVPAYRILKERVMHVVDDRGFLKGIDGRRLMVRSKHSALNTLLQNAGAVVVKYATVIFWAEAQARGLEIEPALHVHDEWQTVCWPQDAEQVGKLKCWAIREAGEKLGFKIPIEGDYKTGSTWADTH